MKKEHEPHDWKEGRRLRAWELSQQGWKQREIAEALGVSKGAVSQWLSRAKAEGIEGLRRHPAPGPQPKLSAEQLAQLPQLLAQGAEAFGYRGEVWTTQRVAEVIKCHFGVSYHPAHCSRILRTLKHSVQKPVERATQRDEAAIESWSKEHWPELKKKPGRRTERSSL
jgi:transposase